MEEIISIKGVRYVVIERINTNRYRMGEVVASLFVRRERGAKYYSVDEVLTAHGYEYRMAAKRSQ